MPNMPYMARGKYMDLKNGEVDKQDKLKTDVEKITWDACLHIKLFAPMIWYLSSCSPSNGLVSMLLPYFSYQNIAWEQHNGLDLLPFTELKV